ncbi:MAG: AbrB/MazE/SpoVT family DNA-binding domain-containing protein [Nanoarchaeota archaeon]|nr:AbrB/MazE/SpoVT family DNA-binding domain-containing protein [Nanoarchaeota archaeon]
METTKLSTKGQIIIPERIRRDIKEGTPFIVTRKENLIILKKVEGLNKTEQKELEELNKIWREIEEGKSISMSKKDFLKEMNAW